MEPDEQQEQQEQQKQEQEEQEQEEQQEEQEQEQEEQQWQEQDRRSFWSPSLHLRRELEKRVRLFHRPDGGNDGITVILLQPLSLC